MKEDTLVGAHLRNDYKGDSSLG